MNADDLLAGPRGRRLCSELLRSDSIFGAVRRGELVVSDVAQKVDAVLSGPDPELAIFEAFSSSVSAARYWQDPDDDDVLLAAGQAAQRLRPAAEAVVRHASTQWWSMGVDLANQVHTMPDWTSQPLVFEKPVASRLRDAAQETIADNERMRQQRRAGGEAEWSMTSATWWTPPIWAAPDTTRLSARFGPLELSLAEDSIGNDQARSWTVTASPTARIFEVDSASAWTELVSRYPMDVTFARGANWLQATRRDGAWAIPDWHAVSADYDAVHLTAFGYLTASGRVIDINGDTASFIAGWHPDATYWLTNLDVDHDEAVRWTQASDELWHRAA